MIAWPGFIPKRIGFPIEQQCEIFRKADRERRDDAAFDRFITDPGWSRRNLDIGDEREGAVSPVIPPQIDLLPRKRSPLPLISRVIPVAALKVRTLTKGAMLTSKSAFLVRPTLKVGLGATKVPIWAEPVC